MLEKTLESPLDCKDIQPVHSKGDQPWMFFGRNDAKAETPVLWPPHAKSWLIGKDSDAGKDWGQEKGTTENEMAGWHHQLNGHGFGWTPGVGDGQGGLVSCGSWGRKRVRHNWATKLNWTRNMVKIYLGKERRGPILIVVVEGSTRAWFVYQRVKKAYKLIHKERKRIIDDIEVEV